MIARGAAVLFGLVVGLALAEGALRFADLPRFHRAHTSPSQFSFLEHPQTGQTFFVNKRDSEIVFEYDSDPRGYFGAGNRVVHETNANGFRGAACSLEKPERTIRIVFLGDSFTFGEGVRLADTFAERSGALLAAEFRDAGLHFEVCNLGVSGYNSADELFLYQTIVPRLSPDAVIVGYVINDAEPPLFEIDPERGPVRRARELEVAEGVASPTPPEHWIYRLRVAQLVWQFRSERRRGDDTIRYYRALYGADAEGWQQAASALGEIVSAGARERIPTVVMLFPVLYQLDGNHPFADLYEQVREQVEAAGGEYLNLLTAFLGHDAESLWVHPTDQHPNELAHRIAAEELVRRLGSSPGFRARLSERNAPG